MQRRVLEILHADLRLDVVFPGVTFTQHKREQCPLAFCPIATAADLQVSCFSHGRLQGLRSERKRVIDLVLLMMAKGPREQGGATEPVKWWK